MNKSQIVIVDDEPQIRRLLKAPLEQAGYVVHEAGDVQSGQKLIQRVCPDAVVLDLGLPDEPGTALLRRLREWNPVPVLILSVQGQESDKIDGLDAGADDYLTKPFGTEELLARLRALLRRIKPDLATSAFRFGKVEADLTQRLVKKEGQTVRLTSTEYALLRHLIVYRDQVLTHQQILRELWGVKADRQTHYLRTYMLRLRQKLEDDIDAPRYFLTETGVGYSFRPEGVVGR